ncbi:MAG: MotA/TolQ/ExbB proton channel family protein [Oleiphilaceae bacterium]|nr:MotA/TolQ/ExbB proton channel family protein [Oleiphilaceae bacterium]
MRLINLKINTRLLRKLVQDKLLKRSCVFLAMLVCISANAQTDNETSLDILLTQLNQDKTNEAAIHREREKAFLAEKNEQATKLADMRKQEQQARIQYDTLQKTVMAEAQNLEALSEQLEERAHHLKDLFSVARQVASDTQQDINASLNSTQYPDLRQTLPSLLQSKSLPEIKDLKALWFVLLKDIQASGEVTNYPADVYQQNGEKITTSVLRMGPFTARTDTQFLSYVAKQQRLQVLASVEEEKAPVGTSSAGLFNVIIDPTRGQLLAQIEKKASLADRVRQGGYVGGVIILLGLTGLAFTAWRLFYLSKEHAKIRQQLCNPETICKENPLGRVLAVGNEHLLATENLGAEQLHDKYEGLEVKLNEAVLREAPSLDRGTGFIKLLATVAPLLGLLGTVTGMIATFQAITLFGTGDPKLMAGGISQALVTTVLGLIVAIPLLFGHSLVVSRVKGLLLILSQESLSLVAQTLEGTSLQGSRIEDGK